jgi:hypothetical protein
MDNEYRGVKRRIAIRIYARAKDYDCISEKKITLENNGDLSIGRMQHELGDLRTCQVSFPMRCDVGQIHSNG